MKMYKKFEDYWQNYIERDLKYKFIKRIEEGDKGIKEFRELWDIPVDGFETIRDAKEWVREQKKNSNHRTFRASLNEEELKYTADGFLLGNPISSKKEELWERKTEAKGGFYAKFEVAVRKLMRQIRLDPWWFHPFVNHILLNEKDMRSLNSAGIQVSERVFCDNKNKEIERWICLTFGPNIRLKDIQQIWTPQVKKLQEKLPGYCHEDVRVTEEIAKKHKLGKYSNKRGVKPTKVKPFAGRESCQE